MAAFAEDEAAYTEIAEGVYVLENNGYLVLGEGKAALIDGRDNETVQALCEGKELLTLSTGKKVKESIDLDGKTLEPISVEGTLTGTVYLDTADSIMFAGDLLGDGEARLTTQYPDSMPSAYIDNYRGYLAGLNALVDASENMNALTILTGNSVQEKQYLLDMQTLIGMFVDADTDLVLYNAYDEGNIGDYRISLGSASAVIHMPFLGLYGYDLGGTTLCESDEDYRYYICDEGTVINIQDTDIQGAYVLMDDSQALVIDVDMYNGDLFWETVEKVIGDRELHVYITHGHGDHTQNLNNLDPARLTALYWPKDEVSDRFNPEEHPEIAAKTHYVVDGEEFTVAGRDFAVCTMTGHTEHGTALVDKTDRILFSGDTIGSQYYNGGTSTGRLTLDEYIAELDRLLSLYGDALDTIYSGHNMHYAPNLINYLKAMCHAAKEGGEASLINNSVYVYNGKVMSAEEITGLQGNGMMDSQMVYAGSLQISATALEAMTE